MWNEYSINSQPLKWMTGNVIVRTMAIVVRLISVQRSHDFLNSLFSLLTLIYCPLACVPWFPLVPKAVWWATSGSESKTDCAIISVVACPYSEVTYHRSLIANTHSLKGIREWFKLKPVLCLIVLNMLGMLGAFVEGQQLRIVIRSRGFV